MKHSAQDAMAPRPLITSYILELLVKRVIINIVRKSFFVTL